MRAKILIFSLVLSLAAAAVCLAGDEQTHRDLDVQWSAAAAAKDVDKTVSFYSGNATVLAPNTAMVTTNDGIRKIWAELLASPGLAISWKVTKVEMAKSGDMAYVTGTYEMTMNDAAGKPTKIAASISKFLRNRLTASGSAVLMPSIPTSPPLRLQKTK